MRSSAEWLQHFQENRHSLLDIPWHTGPELTARDRRALGRSLQEFQRGESSEGHHFLGYAERYAVRTGDRAYVLALKLFIAEEQRHARALGRFLRLNGIPLVASTWSDRAFRLLRHLLGTLEISIAVLVTAEIIAEVYYAALRAASGSVVLQRLCEQILRDEAGHVEFQADQLARLRAGRGPVLSALTLAGQRALFLGACLVVWVVHHRAFRAGGWDSVRFWRAAWSRFGRAFDRGSRHPLQHVSPHRLGRPVADAGPGHAAERVQGGG